jgi:N12 class adenine-specific DNA methylase
MKALAALKSRRDDMVTLEETGIDQIIVDGAREFRELSFTTNQADLKGADPDGSRRARDLFVKARYLVRKRRGRAPILASGTPITNTPGEMRFLAPEALQERTRASSSLSRRPGNDFLASSRHTK